MLARLADEITALGLLEDVTVGPETLRGTGRFAATESSILVIVDPEPEETGGVDSEALVASLQGILALAGPRWDGIVDEIAGDIEESVGDAAVEERADLRDDLDLVAVTVFADASLLEFAAPRQFPTARLQAQLGEGLELEDLEVVETE